MKPQEGAYAERAIRYRSRAEELRIIAEDWTSRQARGTLLRLAATYDDAACQVEKMAELRRPL